MPFDPPLAPVRVGVADGEGGVKLVRGKEGGREALGGGDGHRRAADPPSPLFQGFASDAARAEAVTACATDVRARCLDGAR